MQPVLGYILLGLSLSAPIGPINSAQLDRGIRHGFLHAWLLGLGAMLADMVFMVLVYFGVIHFLNTGFMQTLLWLFGCFVLVYSGVESVIGASKLSLNQQRSAASKWNSFASGLLLSFSNPLSILFWLGIYGSVLADMARKSHFHDLAVSSLAIVFGIFLWDLTMAGAASTFRKYLTDRLLKVISILSGLSLIGFGIYFGIEAVRLLFFQ